MEENTPTTLERIQEAAMTEFLDKGFLGASLRQIVKNAGVTTGAFYGYFSSKEALFASIVEPHAKAGAAAGAYGDRILGLCPLDGGLHLPAPPGSEAAPVPGGGHRL